jgi:ATP-binding cassette subfamily B protein/subfamily B ATP-binding cassette protein MsbA
MKLANLRGSICLILLCLAMCSVIAFITPLIIRSITDRGMIAGEFELVLRFSVLLLIFSAAEKLLGLWQSRLFADFENQFQYALEKDAFDKLLRLKLSYFTDKNSASIINQISTDIGSVCGIADRSLLLIVSSFFTIASGLVGLIVISWKMTLVVLAVVPMKYWISKALSKRQEKIRGKYIDDFKSYVSWYDDTISGIKEIKLWNLYFIKQQVFKKKISALMEDSKGSAMVDAYNQTAAGFLGSAVSCALYIIGGYLLSRHEMTVGGVFAFISYSGYVTGPVSSVLGLRLMFARVVPSLKRLFDFLDLEEEKNRGAANYPTNVEDLKISHISFDYGEKAVLKDVSLHIGPREHIAIIGDNGSGKSTIINILMRFTEPKSGNVTLNGKDINDFAIDGYRDLFAVVSQDPYLFQATILQNIDLQDMHSEDETSMAIRQSGADALVAKMPAHVNHAIAKDGSNLSGGERQKIAVARAILKDSPVIILDEATSQFDVDSCEYLQKVIKTEFASKIVILITHNYDHLQDMSRVYRLENGILLAARADDCQR